MARPRKLVGIVRSGTGWRAFVRVNGKLIAKRFPLNTPIAEMVKWREDQIDHGGGGGGSPGTLAGDVTAYLAKPDAVQTYAHMFDRWIDALGGARRRSSITKDDIEAVIQGWLKTLSQPTVYHRRTALQTLYVKLDGEEAYNPVKHTTRPAPHVPKHKALDHATMLRIVDHMTDERYIKKGIRQPSLAKLAVTVMLHTGLPYAEIQKLTPRHLADLDAGRYIFPAREKGAGTDEALRPLSPAGLAALRAFHAANPYGRLPVGNAVTRSFKRAARAILGKTTAVTTYWLRHSFGTDLYERTGDTATVGRLMGHAPGSPMTELYTKGAHADVDARALAALSESRAAHSLADKLPAKLPRLSKRKENKELKQAG